MISINTLLPSNPIFLISLLFSRSLYLLFCPLESSLPFWASSACRWHGSASLYAPTEGRTHLSTEDHVCTILWDCKKREPQGRVERGPYHIIEEKLIALPRKPSIRVHLVWKKTHVAHCLEKRDRETTKREEPTITQHTCKTLLAFWSPRISLLCKMALSFSRDAEEHVHAQYG